MDQYILIALCIFCSALGCEQKKTAAVEKPQSNVEVIADTEAFDYAHSHYVRIISVHDDKRGVTCYISYPGDVQMSCLPDVWISGKVPVPVIAPQDAQKAK